MTGLRVHFVHDPDTVDVEGPTINRLAVGLVADGERVACVLDPQSRDVLPSLAGVDRLEVPFRVPPWRRGVRRALLGALSERRPPEVVVARGRPSWPVAAELAELHGAPLAIECWVVEAIGPLARFARRHPDLTAIAPTEAMAGMLRERLGEERVRLVPIGVPVPATPANVLDRPDDAIAVAILGPATDVATWRSVVAGLARTCRDLPQVHAFIELGGPAAHATWQELERHDLLGRTSCVAAAPPLRALITRCDLLVVPEPPGRVRSVVLEAMAMGMPVIAAPDPCLDMLADGETADVADRPDAETWASLLGRRLADPVAARALGLRGRSRVARDFGSTARVGAMAALLQSLRTAHAEKAAAAAASGAER